MTDTRGKMLRKRGMLHGIILIATIVAVIGPSSSLKIYEHLTDCYRRNNTEPWAPSSLHILLELIRKVEEAYPTSINMRMMAVSILHGLRIDGIQKAPGVHETEYTIPYGVNKMMASKFKLILDSVSNTPNPINFTEVLTPLELCTFHRLVSSTVEPSLRGDESKTCSPNLSTSADGQGVQCLNQKVVTFPNGVVQVTPQGISRCPEEKGVVRTFQYGSLSPGSVIGAIAAGLQPQQVPIEYLLQDRNDVDKNTEKFRRVANQVGYVDNLFIAGIVGDLAEVCAQQAPYRGENVSVGFTGYWDDMQHPMTRYLVNGDYNSWQLTDSEILAGLDSYHLGKYVNSWVKRMPMLRLSQLLEMYYSSRGIPGSSVNTFRKPALAPDSGTDATVETPLQKGPYLHMQSAGDGLPNSPYLDGTDIEDSFDSLDSACERERMLERMSIHILKNQTGKWAQVLQFLGPMVAVEETVLLPACYNAVDRFFTEARTLLSRLPSCKNIPTSNRRANVDLTMILDTTRDEVQTRKLIGVISELIDVSTYGSYISVINGGTSDVVVSRTNSVLRAMQELRYFSGERRYTSSFSLSTSLSKVVQMFSTYNNEMAENASVCQRARVVLVVSQGQKITDDDFKNAEWLFSGSLQQFRNVYYVFVTNDHKAFEALMQSVMQTSYVLPNQYTIIDSSDLEPKTFLSDVGKILRKIPKQLFVPTCDEVNSQTENTGAPKRNQFEDYVGPNQANYYSINPTHLRNVSELRIQFEGVGYGTFTVCMVQGVNQCQSTAILEVLLFNISQPCQSDDVKTCSDINFSVELDSSNIRCTEADCRYPDQVRYLVTLHNMGCSTDGASRPFNCAVFLLLALVMLLLNV
ncbi:uncharacterized protein LOC119654365 [Hermetia illucens]|nr:uncharacterized protein LOC119654365 [Hermetia illucens]